MQDIVKKIEENQELVKFKGVSHQIVKIANEIVIKSDTDLPAVVDIVHDAANNIDTVEGILNPIASDLNAAHKKVTGLRKAMIDPFKQAIDIMKDKFGTYLVESGSELKSVKTEKGGLSASPDIGVEIVDERLLLASMVKNKLPMCVEFDVAKIKKWKKDFKVTDKQAEAVGLKITKKVNVRIG